MSVFCKGCRKTNDNEEFGLKADGTQYKTYIKCRNKKMNCRNKKNKKSEEEIIECCDVELLRDTFQTLNCEIVYANELTCMMDLDSGLARAFLTI